jgi:3-oxoacyl-[acyl-carrier protein] reductase
MLCRDKVAVVTGGTSGIGKAIARKLAAEGAHVCLFGRNAERGAEAVAEIEASGGSAQFFQVDVGKHDAVDEAIQALLKEHGAIDILVNNAGITRDGLLMRLTEDHWDSVLETNLKSAFNTCRAVARAMLKNRSGKVVNISSVVGLTGNAGQTHYSASKSGLIGFTKSLAREFASRGICVNCVAPGFIQTPMTDELTEEQRKAILNSVPLGRMGEPEEIANAVAFLAGPHSDYITGQVLTVDGGMVMQ